MTSSRNCLEIKIWIIVLKEKAIFVYHCEVFGSINQRNLSESVFLSCLFSLFVCDDVCDSGIFPSVAASGVHSEHQIYSIRVMEKTISIYIYVNLLKRMIGNK